MINISSQVYNLVQTYTKTDLTEIRESRSATRAIWA